MLKRQLVDSVNCPNTRPYDPTIYQENEEDYIIVGAGKYYITKLAEDFLSIVEEFTQLEIFDENNKPVSTGDKSTLFKREDIYYLVWGGKYAVSKNLHGPYKYKGEYNPNCNEHNDFFLFKGRWYMVSEHPEISHFYRGVNVVSIDFDENGNLLNPNNYNLSLKEWHFKKSTMGFKSMDHDKLTVAFNENGFICGEVFAEQAYLKSSIWCGVLLGETSYFEITLKNQSQGTVCTVGIACPDDGEKNPFKNPVIDWSKQSYFNIDIQPNSDEFITYKIAVNNAGKRIKQLAVAPIANADSGQFNIKQMEFKI